MKTTYLLLLIGILFYGCKREDNILFRTKVYVTAVDGNTGLPVKDAVIIISGNNELDEYRPNNPYSENYKDDIRQEGKTDEEGKYEIKFRTKSRRKYTFYCTIGVKRPQGSNYISNKIVPNKPEYDGFRRIEIGKRNKIVVTFYK